MGKVDHAAKSEYRNGKAPLTSGSLSHSVITRAPYLLPMKYRVSELARELGIKQHQVRYWIEKGLQHETDSRGRVFIFGGDVALWVHGIRRNRSSIPLHPEQMYCVSCRKVVTPSDTTKVRHDGFQMKKGICPNCGNKLNKGVKNDKTIR